MHPSIIYNKRNVLFQRNTKEKLLFQRTSTQNVFEIRHRVKMAILGLQYSNFSGQKTSILKWARNESSFSPKMTLFGTRKMDPVEKMFLYFIRVSSRSDDQILISPFTGLQDYLGSDTVWFILSGDVISIL